MKMQNDICEITFVDEKKIDEIKMKLPDLESSKNVSETFKILGDSTRLRILLILSIEELCVCDIAALLEASISSVSHQLRILRDRRLVKNRKEGKMVYYSLNDIHVKNIIDDTLNHLSK